MLTVVFVPVPPAVQVHSFWESIGMLSVALPSAVGGHGGHCRRGAGGERRIGVGPAELRRAGGQVHVLDARSW